ncbi:MAG TPA: iron-containing redox enzyme family protein, partial [Polyangiaceae bacterium]|nr:iron-containing redox enzyme family protein [Polyangiaceae bacterium]
MTRFERGLRERVDSKYLREPTADNPLWRLVNDRLPLEECRAFYLGLRDSLAIFNRVLLGRLLEESPTEKARSELLPVIAVEFGPPASAAHPAIFKRFLRSLGVSESETHESADLLAATNVCASEVEALGNMSWCELLARLLVGETQGPVVFPVILDALRRNYGLSSFDVQYFSIHATHDKKDTEILFDLLARTVKSQVDQDAVLRVVDEAFDGGRYVVTGCRLEASPRYRFADYSSTTMRKKA